MADRAGNAADDGGRIPDRGRDTDPLTQTMPWVPDDDPILRELRAWRDDLSTGRSETGEAASSSTPVVDAPSLLTAEAPDRVSVQQAPPQEETSQQRTSQPHARRQASAPAQPARQRPHRPRHAAAWNVMSSVRSESIEDEEELRLANLRTVAFPSIDPATLSAPTDDRPPAIVAKGLRKSFGDFTAVADVSFEVPAGTIVALLGPNGAGKTTTVNMLCTLLSPDSGSASVAGYDVVSEAAGVRTSIMLTGQFAALDESLTGRENLVLFGRLLGMTKKQATARADELLTEFSLTEAGGKRVGQYSGGMRRRIDIACGLVASPDVVFLDEPTTGLDPRSRQDVWALVEGLRDSGVTILLTTQYLEEADILSDNIVVIDKGRVIAEGTSDELKSATGAAYCEVTPAHPAYLPRLRARLRDLIGHAAADDVDNDEPTVSVPAPHGPQTLAEVMRRTEAAKIPLADIGLRRPSLDEVFLALTGDGDERSSGVPKGPDDS